jgi:hypothetical protein
MHTPVVPENPYIRLPITFDPAQFYGPLTAVRAVLECISAAIPHSTELAGLPGMGKSTLLRYLAHPEGALAQHRAWLGGRYAQAPEGIFPICVEFRLCPADMHPFLYLSRRFHEEFAAYQQRVAPALLAPDFRLPAPPAGPEPASADVAQTVNALEQATEALAEQGVRPVLLLDDFDVAFARLDYEETTRLRPWRDSVAFVLVTEEPLHRVNPLAVGSPFFQVLTPVYMDGLARAEAREMLEDPARRAGHPFPTEDVDAIVPLAGGHPYLLIRAGAALWDLRERLGLLAPPGPPLSGEQHAVLRGDLQTGFTRSFELYWARLEVSEQTALETLLHGGAGAPKSSHYASLSSLARKGLVAYDLEHGYTFFSPLFAEFLRTRPAVAPAPAAPPPPAEPPAALDLTGYEGRLYDYLRLYPGRVCSFDELWDKVWEGPRSAAGQDQIRRRMQVTVSRLRNKLKKATGEDVVSVRDQGYRLTTPAIR